MFIVKLLVLIAVCGVAAYISTDIRKKSIERDLKEKRDIDTSDFLISDFCMAIFCGLVSAGLFSL